MNDRSGLKIGLSAFTGILAGFAVSGLLLSGLGLLGAGITGAGLTTSSASPTLYKINITRSGTTCQVKTTWTGAFGIHHSSTSGWVTISESNNDTVAWVYSGSDANKYSITFPDGDPVAYPGTPFFDFKNTNWVSNFASSQQPVSSPVATLTPTESKAGITRFPYQSVKFTNPDFECPTPIQGMGIQVTK